jgi:hypothetical protein
MPKIVCKCGQWLRYGDIPNPIEWLFISDVEYDKFSGSVDAEVLYRAMKSFLQCPICGRLWVFWNGFGSDPDEYIPRSLLDKD